MNFFVHSVMYGYYALTAACMRPKWLKGGYVTFLQLSQVRVNAPINRSPFQFLTWARHRWL